MSIKSLQADVLIIGAGPAGLTAGLYAARAGKKALILEGSGPSRLEIAYKLENYPGFPSIDSRKLLDIIRGQALSFGAEVIPGDAIAYALDGDRKYVTTKDAVIEAGAVILATGKPFPKERMILSEVIPGDAIAYALDGDRKYVTTKDAVIEAGAVILATGKPFPKERMILGEDRLVGQGVSYCATCDGPLFRGGTVAAVGHSEEALEDVHALQVLGCRVLWGPG